MIFFLDGGEGESCERKMITTRIVIMVGFQLNLGSSFFFLLALRLPHTIHHFLLLLYTYIHSL